MILQLPRLCVSGISPWRGRFYRPTPPHGVLIWLVKFNSNSAAIFECNSYYICIVPQIYPHGSTDTLPFATMGSGSLAAMAVFESKYREGLTVSLYAVLFEH